MDFTRQPIIETVISPSDGHKLLIRNSKEANQEEYLVNAVEVVSFGTALFYRCLERRPRPFLLPIADYDVVEVKEARMVLKNISTDKPIKIGEGKTSSKASKEEASSDTEGKKSAKKRNSRKRRSSKVASENESSENTPNTSNTSNTSNTPKPPVPRHPRENNPPKVRTPTSENAVPVVSVIFPPPPKIIGRIAPEDLPGAPTEKKASTSKKVEEKKEVQEDAKPATSKDLPPLDEIKEAKKHPEEVKKES